MNFKTILFDVDGTLIDSTDALLEAFRRTHSQLHLNYPGDKVMRRHFGKSLKNIISDLGINKELVEEFVKIFTETELSSSRFNIVKPMEKCIFHIIDNLNGLNLVTSKRYETAKHALRVTGLEKYVSTLITADNVERTKPNPEPLLTALRKLERTPSKDVVYIGDSIPDIIASEKAGISSIGVMWGVHGEELKNISSVTIVESCEELLNELGF